MATTATTAPTAKKRKMSDDESDSLTGASADAASVSCACKASGCDAPDAQQHSQQQLPSPASTATPSSTTQAPQPAQPVSPRAHHEASTGAAPVAAPTAKPPAYKMTFHRRVLPQECIAFSSVEGRQLFTDAITSASANYMQIYFPLAEQFTTQAEPAFCGLATLAMCLNALHIDPGRLWKGPWRWFSEELLDCCTPLETAKEQGISFDQFVCLARCNGAFANGLRADDTLTLARFRELVKRSCASSDEIVVLNYTRKALEQTGDGHFSPIGGYNEASDMVLLLDVARFKYPPHWVRLPLAFEAMQRVDASSGLPRGVVLLRENAEMTGPSPANQILASRAASRQGETLATANLVSCCTKNSSAASGSASSAAARR